MRLIDADAFKEQVVGAALVNGTSKAGEKAETIVKLIDSQPTAYDVDKVSEKIAELTGEECTLHECGIRSEKCKPCIAKNCLDIVHSGGIAPEKPQSKDGKYMQDREKFFGGADFLKKRFLEVK